MKKMFLFALIAMIAINASAQMNVWENGGLSAQYTIENVDSITFGITNVTPSSGTGKDGITPLLKIEDDYWYVSYDEGKTWKKEGKAKGEDGDSMFQSVTVDDKFIYFTLADGTAFKLEKNTTNQNPEGDDIIDFKDLAVKSALLSNGSIDKDGDGEISFKEASQWRKYNITNNTEVRSFKEFQYFTKIQTCNFKGCTNLFEITLPEGLDTISDNAFGNSSSSSACKKLASINIPDNCKYIGKYAFANTSISKINVPEGCDYIGDYAFYYTKLTSVDLPSSVKTIGTYAFNQSGTQLTSFRFPESFTTGGNYIFNKLPKTIYWDAINCTSYKLTNSTYSDTTNVQILFGDKVEIIPARLCEDLGNLTEISLPNSVSTVGEYAFSDCNKLQTITLPENLELINTHAFEYCSSMEEINIPNKVQIIGAYAFYSCSKVETITLGESVEIINDYAFYGTNATKIYCKAKYPPYAGSNAFPSSALIYVPRESVAEYRATWSAYATKIMGYDFE